MLEVFSRGSGVISYRHRSPTLVILGLILWQRFMWIFWLRYAQRTRIVRFSVLLTLSNVEVRNRKHDTFVAFCCYWRLKQKITAKRGAFVSTSWSHSNCFLSRFSSTTAYRIQTGCIKANYAANDSFLSMHFSEISNCYRTLLDQPAFKWIHLDILVCRELPLSASYQVSYIFCKSLLTVLLQFVPGLPGPFFYHGTSQYNDCCGGMCWWSIRNTCPYVCLFVCLSVCPQHISKRIIPKYSNLV